MTTARSLPRALADDAHTGARAACGGLAVAALVELVATWWELPGGLGLALTARLALLDLTLFALLGLVVVPLVAVAATLPRLRHALRHGRAAARAWRPPWRAPSRWSPAAAPRLLAAGLGLLVYLVLVAKLGTRFERSLREPTLTALVLAVLALVVAALAAVAGDVVAIVGHRLRAFLARRAPRLVGFTPVGSPWVALVVIIAAAIATLVVVGKLVPHLKPVWPWRRMLTALAFVVGVGLERELAWVWRPRPRRRHGLAVALPALVLVPATLVSLGGHPRVKAAASTWSPTLAQAIALVRRANDLDRDGFGSLLGENDCGPRDRRIHPGAEDKPDNGIDENCNGRDFSMRDLVAPSGPRPGVPPAFRKKWNVLFVTIDTVRYDHTTFGGRKAKTGRDTTPNLARLVSRSTSFTFAQAPTPGTMGSMPALITSRYFHSGVALDETNIKPGMPPRLKPENVTIAEVMKDAGYATGAILSHEYFNDWGMQQGFDSYDNSIGATHDPYRVTDDKVTDRAISWIAAHAGRPWFLWTHYLDPHSQYVPHPGETSYGDSQEDIYDGELHFTDKQLGRLIDELYKLPGGDQTIIVITADHGDGFGEHGFTGHAIALARELLHVPLIVHVPDAPARQVGGTVSGLDLFPTVAELCGIDLGDLQLEGKSLVPQIFYGTEEPDRVVFAETNYPNPLRSATNTRWKLIFNLKGNFYELYDLVGDPVEKSNVAGRRQDGMDEMKPHLDAWLDRVVFTRDPSRSQVAMKMAKMLLPGPPTPSQRVSGVTLDDGAIEVLGFDLTGTTLGGKAKLAVYLHAVRAPTRRLRLGGALVGLVGGSAGADNARAPVRITLDGLFASDRWHAGDYLREEWTIAIPATWSAAEAAVGLTAVDAGSGAPGSAGPSIPGDPATLDLGRVTMPVATPPPPPPPAPAGIAPATVAPLPVPAAPVLPPGAAKPPESKGPAPR